LVEQLSDMTSQRVFFPATAAQAAARGRGRLRLSDGRTAAAEARTFVRAVLGAWQADALALQDAVVVASELASNAVQHGGGDPVLELLRRDDRVVVRVGDEQSGLPRRQPHDPSASRGRGLLIVEAMAQAWGHERDAGRTWVWAELRLDRARVPDGSLV
jgi:anti-sigma regulatory factor (Ser/Thr protein kinase)